MSRNPLRGRRAVLGAVAVGALLVGPVATAHADPVDAGEASAFGATITVAGEEVIPPTPEQTAAVGDDNTETVVDIPADPLALSGTLTANAAVHEASDLESNFVTEGTTHTTEGPYNAVGEAVIEDLDVLLDVPEDQVSLLSADVVRAEAVGVCRDGVVEYSANSEIVGLFVGGNEIPVNAPVQDIVDAISDVLEQTTLDQVVNVERNVTNVDANGASVDALVVTVLAAAGEDPLAQVRIGHAEASGLTCGAAAGAAPECSDGIDNDGDGVIDFPNDPGCESAEDDSELDGGMVAPGAEAPECSDGVDNDGDGDIDFPADSGCTSADDDSEAGGGAGLPRTGGESTTALLVGATLALGAFGLRRMRLASLS